MVTTTPSLLITDDDRAWREILGKALRATGYQTILAADGEEALEIVHQSSIDLVLADHHMPRLDGLELLRRLQVIGYELPAILVTADFTAGVQEEARQANAVMVLPKPVALRQLRQVIADVLATRLGRTHPRRS